MWPRYYDPRATAPTSNAGAAAITTTDWYISKWWVYLIGCFGQIIPRITNFRGRHEYFQINQSAISKVIHRKVPYTEYAFLPPSCTPKKSI